MAELTINTADISAAIRKNLEGFNPDVELTQVGRVLEVGDGIARVSGLPDAAVNELLEFESGLLGLALNLDEESIGAVVLGEVDSIEEGQSVRATGNILSVPVGDGVIGRVVNTLGEPLDGKGPLSNVQDRRMEIQAPGIMGRQPVGEPMQTGIKAIDSLIPIGRGQRELIIGDRKTGKTTVAIDTILNQRGLGVKCIYVAIGQKASTVAQTGRRSSTSPPTPGAPWASTGWSTVSTRSSSTTTCPSRPRPTVRCRCCCAVRRAVRRTPVTSSTSTRACSSAPRSSPTRTAPAR
jgi:F-type H+-transporting ATPase subunit alpha